MHWRPDFVMKTGVIEPMWIRQVSPVDMARHTIDPFIDSVRGPGPAVSPSPAPEQIAEAASQVARAFAAGKPAVIAVGLDKVQVKPGDGARIGGAIGLIVQAAERLARGEAVAIDLMGRRLIVSPAAGGGVQMQAQASEPRQVDVRNPSQGLGMLPAQWAQPIRPVGPGNVYNYPAVATSDSPYRQTMMQTVKTWAPSVTAEVHAADGSVRHLQRTQPAEALSSRPALPTPYYDRAQTYAQQIRRSR